MDNVHNKDRNVNHLSGAHNKMRLGDENLFP